VTKARILQAVAQAKDQRAADRIEHLKKGDMAAEAETLLADTGWLPEPLRTPGQPTGEEQAPESAVVETPAQSSEKLLEDEDEPAAQNDDTGEPMIAAE
jgi:ParB family transcriptional regulator, chromosome partitioning protein